MPLEISEHTTDAGNAYLRADASGQVTLEHAKQFEAAIKRPQWHHGLVLSVVAKGTEYAPDARRHFATLNADVRALATVVTSPIVRATLNMIFRLGELKGDNPMKMFTSQDEALKWLESHAA